VPTTLPQYSGKQKSEHMLQQFTWSQFLIAALILTLLWYLILMLTTFRQSLAGLFFRSPIKNDVSGERYPGLISKQEAAEELSVMGKSRLAEGVEVLSMSDLHFGSGTADDGKLGLVPDVIKELNDIFSTLASEDGNRQDFFILQGIVREKYGAIATHPSINQINQFIKENAPFSISEQELDNLWN